MKRNVLLVFLLAVCCVLFFPSVTADEVSVGDFWETKTAMPQAASGIKAVTVEDSIYVFGKTFTYMYTPATDTWTQKTAMPTPRVSYAIAALDNKVYVIGGQGPNGESSVNEGYDVLTDTWEKKQPLYPARDKMDANVVDGKIYVIGGIGAVRSDKQGFDSLTEVYDPATDSWTQKTSPPKLMSSHLSCVIDKKIYIINQEFDVDIYNTKTDQWSKAADIPEFYSSRGIAATTGNQVPERIYVIGGFFSPRFMDLRMVQTNYVYDPASDSWNIAADMPTARAGFAVAVLKDKIYCIGGALTSNVITGQETGVVEVYTPQGYQNNSPSSSPGNTEEKQPILTETTTIIIGVTVSATIITATSITVYHYKHTSTKTSKSP
ncbi:MAG: hypothetical protein NWF01_03235 [Candidatus Bathyarchaeota archaeon]|nr:hypothetical protein [Candidatus Bathyarchaeota archaeon]